MSIANTSGFASSLAAQASQVRSLTSSGESSRASATPLPMTAATGAAQAQQGAAAAQPGQATFASAPAPAAPVPATTTTTTTTTQEPRAEVFNAPKLDLPDDPSTVQVMDGLVAAMADPTVNDSSANRLYEFHKQMLDQYKQSIQVIIDGMVR